MGTTEIILISAIVVPFFAFGIGGYMVWRINGRARRAREARAAAKGEDRP